MVINASKLSTKVSYQSHEAVYTHHSTRYISYSISRIISNEWSLLLHAMSSVYYGKRHIYLTS